MTIEIYEGHAFLIKDIKKLAKLYACVDCQRASQNLATCSDTLKHLPQTAYERAFNGKSMCSPSSIRWLERISKTLIWEAHLSRSMWARWIDGAPFYGYAPSTKTVF